MHDLERVAVLNGYVAQAGARHDLEVALDGNLDRVEAKLAQHPCNGHCTRQTAVLTVDANRKASIENH